MIPKTDFFERIEDYCLERLHGKEKKAFETELLINEELREETILQKEIISAITENEVLNLRDKISEIIRTNQNGKINTSFELLADVKNVNLPENPSENIEINVFHELMPRVHVIQHNATNGENIHKFYTEQFSKTNKNNNTGLNGFDDKFSEVFEGIDEALLENDIMDLREQLKLVAKEVKTKYSTEEIEKYLDGNLNENELEFFAAELGRNKELQAEIEFQNELNLALKETDIFDLRDKIRNIVQRETSWSVTSEQIENYIDGNLQGLELIDFEQELSVNSGLKEEILFRNELNKALKETDIMKLRQKLGDINEESKERELKSLISDNKLKFIRFLLNSVAIFILAAGIFVTANYLGNTPEVLYKNYYQSPVVGPVRSTSVEYDLMQEANSFYSRGDYQNAIPKYQEVLGMNSNDFVARFYLGSSFQITNKYHKAITQFSRVIEHGDNEFIEEAEWYRALCYLKLEDKKNARKELLAIKNKQGYYEKNAGKILKKLK